MNARGCYCELRKATADTPRRKDVPEGFCGLCDRCGAPGHVRHFPGAVPYTGAWCDAHYRRLRLLHPLAFPGMVLWIALAVVVLGFVRGTHLLGP